MEDPSTRMGRLITLQFLLELYVYVIKNKLNEIQLTKAVEIIFTCSK